MCVVKSLQLNCGLTFHIDIKSLLNIYVPTYPDTIKKKNSDVKIEADVKRDEEKSKNKTNSKAIYQ